MQFTVSALTLLAAVAAVQASCVPIITCGMKREVANHPHAAASASGDDFSNAFAACLNKDKAAIKPAGDNKSFIIHGADGKNDFHDCDALVKIYQTQKSGMKDGELRKEADGSFRFFPTAADFPGWQQAVGSGKSERSINLVQRS